MKPYFEPGALWSLTLERTDNALRSGALQRIPTRCESVVQDDVRFLVPVVENIERKRRAGRVQRSNPFLPYEDDLFVTGVSETHVCLLNKFNVVDHHLLLVTRKFENQEDLLGRRDFEAMWTCMAEFDGLAFYNAGMAAGASQPHKHLQQIPVPLGAGPERIPMERLFRQARFEGDLGVVPRLGFVHALARSETACRMEPSLAAARTLDVYHRMLRRVGLGTGPAPYNLLVTREWMFLVPRSRETYESISVNALGFAGSILVRDYRELKLVHEVGPMTLLEHVALGRRP